MDTFELLKRINQIFGKNYLSGTPEQQKINVALAKVLSDYRKTFKEQK